MKSVATLLVFASWAFIFWPNVESRNGYSYAGNFVLLTDASKLMYLELAMIANWS